MNKDKMLLTFCTVVLMVSPTLEALAKGPGNSREQKNIQASALFQQVGYSETTTEESDQNLLIDLVKAFSPLFKDDQVSLSLDGNQYHSEYRISLSGFLLKASARHASEEFELSIFLGDAHNKNSTAYDDPSQNGFYMIELGDDWSEIDHFSIKSFEAIGFDKLGWNEYSDETLLIEVNKHCLVQLTRIGKKGTMQNMIKHANRLDVDFIKGISDRYDRVPGNHLDFFQFLYSVVGVDSEGIKFMAASTDAPFEEDKIRIQMLSKPIPDQVSGSSFTFIQHKDSSPEALYANYKSFIDQLKLEPVHLDGKEVYVFTDPIVQRNNAVLITDSRGKQIYSPSLAHYQKDPEAFVAMFSSYFDTPFTIDWEERKMFVQTVKKINQINIERDQ